MAALMRQLKARGMPCREVIGYSWDRKAELVGLFYPARGGVIAA